MSASEILQRALSGAHEKYRNDEGYVKWGVVEKDINGIITSRDEQIKLLKEALEKIKYEPMDDKTPARYIESLKQWQSKACGISHKALKKLEEMEKKGE